MKSIVLPAGTEHVPFGELAHRIADALWPDAGPDDDRMKYGATRVNLDDELKQAVTSGVLPVKDPLTLGPHTFPVGDALNRALVTVGDLRKFVAGRLDVVTTAPAQDTEPTAPVEVVGASDDVTPADNGPAKTATVDRGWVMKKGALIAKHEHHWPTINRDFQDASENGLSKAAKAPGHGAWFEADALNWARQRGKYAEVTEQPKANKATPFTGLTHRIEH